MAVESRCTTKRELINGELVVTEELVEETVTKGFKINPQIAAAGITAVGAIGVAILGLVKVDKITAFEKEGHIFVSESKRFL